MSDALLTVSVRADKEAILLLELEWRELYERAISPSPPQGFDFARALQEAVGPGGPQLLVATCYAGGRIVGLWPLLLSGPKNISAGFGAGEEYSGPLIDAASDGVAVAGTLLRSLERYADVLKTTVPMDNPVRQAVRSRAWWHQHPVRSPITRLTSWPSFDAWMATKSGSFRKGLRYDRRKLAECGSLTLVDGRDEGAS